MLSPTEEQGAFLEREALESVDFEALPEVLPPNSERCNKCNSIYYVGDWPLCYGDPKKHEPTGTFAPAYGDGESRSTIIFRDKHGNIDYSPDGKTVAPGFKPVEKIVLRNTQERDRFERQIRSKESSLPPGVGKSFGIPQVAALGPSERINMLERLSRGERVAVAIQQGDKKVVEYHQCLESKSREFAASAADHLRKQQQQSEKKVESQFHIYGNHNYDKKKR